MVDVYNISYTLTGRHHSRKSNSLSLFFSLLNSPLTGLARLETLTDAVLDIFGRSDGLCGPSTNPFSVYYLSLSYTHTYIQGHFDEFRILS